MDIFIISKGSQKRNFNCHGQKELKLNKTIRFSQKSSSIKSYTDA